MLGDKVMTQEKVFLIEQLSTSLYKPSIFNVPTLRHQRQFLLSLLNLRIVFLVVVKEIPR